MIIITPIYLCIIGDQTDIPSQIYTTLSNPAYCVRLTHQYGQVGCSSKSQI